MAPKIIIRRSDIKRDLNKRSQEEVNKLQEEINDVSEQLASVHQGSEDLILHDGTALSPLKVQAPASETVRDPVELNCYFHWPKYPPGKLRPCIVFLHGASAAVDVAGLPALHSDVWWLKRIPQSCVVIIPHCPSRKRYAWVAASIKASVLHAVEMAVAGNGVDPQRVYIAGYSMGAIGTWEFCADSCEGKASFAAGVPIAGSLLNAERATTLAEARFPMWCWHGEGDEYFNVGPTDRAVAEMLAESVGNVRYTRQKWKSTTRSAFADASGEDGMPIHESAIQAFADDEIFSWLLKQHLDPDEADKLAKKVQAGASTRERPKPYKKEGEMSWEDQTDVEVCCAECGSVPAIHNSSDDFESMYCTSCWTARQGLAISDGEDEVPLVTRRYDKATLDVVASLPGRRSQREVDERWLAQRDHIWGITWVQFQHTHLTGKRELVVKDCLPIPSTEFQGPEDPFSVPQFCPAPLEVFIRWEECPEFQGPRPLLVILHGGGVSREEHDLVGLAYQLWWLHLVPKEVVVIIPQCSHQNQHFLQLEVKATVMSAINTAVTTGCDRHRIYVTGVSQGATAATEWGLDSALGVLPFAASIPITPWLQDMQKARHLADFPMWMFCGANEWRSLVDRCDFFISEAVDGGAGKESLRFTKYEWSPSRYEKSADAPGSVAERVGHATFEQAYGEPGLFEWMLNQRRETFTPWRPKRRNPNLRKDEQLVDRGFEEYPADVTN